MEARRPPAGHRRSGRPPLQLVGRRDVLCREGVERRRPGRPRRRRDGDDLLREAQRRSPNGCRKLAAGALLQLSLVVLAEGAPAVARGLRRTRCHPARRPRPGAADGRRRSRSSSARPSRGHARRGGPRAVRWSMRHRSTKRLVRHARNPRREGPSRSCRGDLRSTHHPRRRAVAVSRDAPRRAPRRGGRPRTRTAWCARAPQRRRRLATISSTETTVVRAARARSDVDVCEVVGRPGELDVPLLVCPPGVDEGDVRAECRDGEQLVAAVRILDGAEAALLDELGSQRGPRRQERKAHHGSPEAADEHPLRELPILDEAARHGGREAASEAVRAEPDVARHDAAQGAGGEEQLHLQRAREGDELEVALARERERPGCGDGLPAEDGPAERDARAVLDERDGVVPAAEPHGWNLGGRFSRKALRPSRASGCASASIAASRSTLSPASRVGS